MPNELFMLPPLLPPAIFPLKGTELIRRAFSFCTDLLVLEEDELYVVECFVAVEVVGVVFGVSRLSGEAGGVS